MALLSPEELRQDFINQLQSDAPELSDDSEGSIIDILSGVVAQASSEIQRTTINEINKTYIETANGPEVTGGPDDLQTLAVDHFGDNFARPEATKSTGTVAFSRPNADYGDCVIPIDTIVKTSVTALGTSIRFKTTQAVTITGTTINAPVEAILEGPSGNVLAGTLTQIEASLLDSSITVTNAAACAGGENAETDAEYRETIRRLVNSIKGGSLSAIEARVLNVAGVETCTAVEFNEYVIKWDIPSGLTVGEYFILPRVFIYVMDANGGSSDQMIADVYLAIREVRSAGIPVAVFGGSAIAQNWSISIVLNPSGPNYATLSADPQMILDEMTKYIQDLGMGDDFVRATAKAYLLAKFGPAGTDDLTDLTVVTPVGDVSIDSNEKLIPGTLAVV